MTTFKYVMVHPSAYKNVRCSRCHSHLQLHICGLCTLLWL